MAINNNLLIYTKDLLKGFASNGNTSTISSIQDSTVGGDTVLTAQNSAADGMVWVSDAPQKVAVQPGETYTVSSDFKANHTGEIYIAIKCLDASGAEIAVLGDYGKRTITFDTWYRISGTFTIPDGIAYIYTTYRFHNTTNTFPSMLYIYHPKLELGSIATNYRPAGVESPNLIRNSHFYKGTDFWSTTDASVMKMEIAEDGNLKATKLVNTNAVHIYSYTTQPLSLNRTYTLTAEIKNSSGTVYTGGSYNRTFLITDGSGNEISGTKLPGNIPSDDQYHTYTVTFTTPASGAAGTRLVTSSTDYSLNQSLYFKSIKLEEGSYQTEWTAAPEDVAIGSDRPVIARAEKTIVDYNDMVGLTINITSSLNLTQQYSTSDGKYTPDWTSTNLVLTPSLYKNSATTNLIGDSAIQSIKWYRVSKVDGANPVQITADATYVLGANTLTIKQNILNDKDSVDFICEVVYRDTLTGKDMLAKKSITVNRVINGAVLTKAKVYLPDGNNLTNGQAQSYESDAFKTRKNLILGSNVAKSSTAYNVGGTYTLTENWVEGEVYTVTIKGTVNTGQKFGIWRDSGSQIFVYLTYDATLDLWIGTATCTATTSTSKNTLSVYNVNSTTATSASIQWIKLEKGNTSSKRWTQPPEEYPAINPGTTPNKWVYTAYENGWTAAAPNAASIPPTYPIVKNLLPLERKLITDTSNLVQGYASGYTGHLKTGVYSERTQTVNITYGADDASNVFVNGQSTYSQAGWSASIPTSFTLNEGWNTLDFMWSNGNGGDGLYGIKVGGTNLQPSSGNFINNVGLWTPNGVGPVVTLDKTVTYNGKNTIKVTNTSGMSTSNWITLKPNTNYVYSMMAKSDIAITGSSSTPLHMWVSDTQSTAHLEIVTSSDTSLPAGQWKLINVKFTTPNVAAQYYMKPFLYGIGSATVNVAYSKVEEGTTPTVWTAAPADDVSVNPNLFGTAFKLDASQAQDYINRITNITAKAELTRASLIDTTNVSYQWYKQDSTIVTDQGGGVGWLKLISTSPEIGYNTNTLTIPSTAIDIFEVYKCAIKDTQVDSITYNTTFEGLVSVTNSTMPITVRVESDGTVFLNGQGNKSLKARLYQNGKEIDTEGTIYTYKWYRWLNSATKDATWNTSGYKSGKTITITSSDVDDKATFSVDVS